MNSLALSPLYGPTLTSLHGCWKNHSFDCMDLYGKVMSLLSNTLSSFAIGEGSGNPLENSCLENPMDGGAW